MIMETRDQWYKPNLLYNIHYRPPKKPEPPKMIVETVQFNPSVCTCGEHSCQPQYRMEKRVLWTNKEVCNAKLKVSDREKKNGYRESNSEERITKQDRKIGSVTESEQMGLKKENGQEYCFMIEGDGNKCGSAESFKGRMPGDVVVRSGYNANYEVKEKRNVEVEGDDDETDEEKKEECVCRNEVRSSDCKDDICIDEEASNTNNIKQNNSNGRSDRDNSEGRNSVGVYGEKRIGNDPESDFNNDCKWGGKGSKEDQTDKDQTTGEGDGTVDRDGACDEREYCSNNRILINNSDETAESCRMESTDGGLEDVEIASAFGIMSIYCNSELHSWRSFKGEDASKERYIDVPTAQNSYILK